MNLLPLKFTVPFILAGSLAACVTGKTVRSDNFKLSYDGLSVTEANKLVSRSEEILQQLESYLKRGHGNPVEIHVFDFDDDNKAHAIYSQSLIEIPVTRFQGPQLDTVLVHEIGHLVAGPSFLGSSLLSEGIAVHLHAKFSAFRSRTTGNLIDLHRTVKSVFMPRGLMPLTKLVNDNLAFANYAKGRTASLGRSQAYIQAGSFVKFLSDTYGIDKFMRAYRDAPFDQVYGKSLGALEQEWLDHIKQY